MNPVSQNPCIVTILVPPAGDPMWIRLVGALDMGAEPALEQAVDRVRNVAPGTVLIDLAGVTFAGSVLVHFLIHVHEAARHARICLLQAKPTIRLLMTAAGISGFVTLGERRSQRPA